MAIIYSYPLVSTLESSNLFPLTATNEEDELYTANVTFSTLVSEIIDEAFNGTDRYIPRFNGTGSLVNSVIYEDTDGHVGVGVVGSPPNPVHKFEVFDLRDENPSSDYSSVVTTHVNAPFTGGGGGILSRLSTDSGATYAGQIAFVPGTIANDIVSNIKLAIHVNSDMNTHSPSNLAGTVTHDNTNAHWILNGTLGETTTATLKVNGSTSIIGDLDVDGGLRVQNNSADTVLDINTENFTFSIGDITGVAGNAYIASDGSGSGNVDFFGDGDVRFRNAGNVGIGTNSPSQKLDVVGSIEVSDGVYIGGTAAANKLDDYEEGTYTPSITATGTDTSGFSSIGYYTKIGDIAHVEMRITKFVDEDESCNVTNITLPFAANNTSTVNYKGSLWHGETFDKSNLYTLLREGTINLTPFNGPINSLLLAADENNTIGVKITYKVQ